MRYLQSLSVGIVLTIMCSPAIAVLDTPLVDQSIAEASSEVKQFTLQKSAPVVDMTILDDTRTRNLKLVYDIASKVGHPEVIQAMLLQESSGGTASLTGNPRMPAAKRSYGVMQIVVSAARSILTRYPELVDRYYPNGSYNQLTNQRIIDMLIFNHEANITIAAYHYRLYLHLSNGNQDRAIAAYNVGIGGVKKIKNPSRFVYVVGVKQKLNTVVKPFNAQYNLNY